MIRIKFEAEEPEETPLPIENENERIKTLLSLKFVGNNWNYNVDSSTTSDSNNGNNVCGTLKEPRQKLPLEMNVVPVEVPKFFSNQNKLNRKPNTKQLDNSAMDSVASLVGSKSIKTEPVESSLSLTTQLNNSLNIQSLLRQNRIPNGWTTNEQSIPIGTKQQQQQQSFFLPKIESIVPDNPEVPLLDQSSSSIPNGTQQQQFLFLPKIEPVDPGIHPKVPLLEKSFSILNPNLNSVETTNFDTTMFPGPRAGLCHRTKLNFCYSILEGPEPTLQFPPSAYHSELASNDNDQHSGSGSIFGFDPSFAFSTTAEVAALSPPPEAVPLLVGKKPLPLGIPPLTLEENKACQMERDRLWYHRQKANPEVRAEKRHRRSEYERKWRQQRLANATPEQLELMRLKNVESVRRHLEKESEEQRHQRLERMKQYSRTVDKQRRDQKRQTLTPEEREKKRVYHREYYKNRKLIMMEKKKKSLEKSQIGQSQSSTSMID